jgi:hypothetical protein
MQQRYKDHFANLEFILNNAAHMSEDPNNKGEVSYTIKLYNLLFGSDSADLSIPAYYPPLEIAHTEMVKILPEVVDYYPYEKFCEVDDEIYDRIYIDEAINKQISGDKIAKLNCVASLVNISPNLAFHREQS